MQSRERKSVRITFILVKISELEYTRKFSTNNQLAATNFY